MKQLSGLFLAFFIATGFNSSAQSLEDAKSYLEHEKVSANAKDFYNSGFKITDHKQALDIADSLCTRNCATRPFYIYLVSKMFDNADRRLLMTLGKKCARFTEARPNAIIEFLTSDNDDVERGFFSKWAGVLAGGYMMGCHGVTDDRINRGLRAARLQCRSINRDELTTLYNEVRAKVCENEVLDRIMEVPEVCAEIKKNGNKLSVAVYRGPVKCSNYYWVRVDKEEAGEFNELYSFFVEAETFDVCYFDQPNDRLMALNVWREKLH